jgi:hypothetical protein
VDAGRAEHHHRAAAALRLLLVVADVAVANAALLAECGAVRRRHDPVLRLAAPDLHRAEQPSELRGHVRTGLQCRMRGQNPFRPRRCHVF